MAAEPDRYLQTLAEACYAEALPRVHVAIHRLVLAPRALVTGRAKSDIATRLLPSPALAGLDEDVRTFVLSSAGAPFAAPPSPKRHHRARRLVCVGVRSARWMDPSGPGPGTNDVFKYELPRQGLTRRDCKAIEAAIERMTRSAAGLSRNARDAMLRSAASLRRA